MTRGYSLPRLQARSLREVVLSRVFCLFLRQNVDNQIGEMENER